MLLVIGRLDRGPKETLSRIGAGGSKLRLSVKVGMIELRRAVSRKRKIVVSGVEELVKTEAW